MLDIVQLFFFPFISFMYCGSHEHVKYISQICNIVSFEDNKLRILPFLSSH